jgi:hypothetical protein
MSMIKGVIFKVSWSLQTLGRHRFKSFSMHITRFKSGQPTSPSMKIWWIIFGFKRETTRSQPGRQPVWFDLFVKNTLIYWAVDYL